MDLSCRRRYKGRMDTPKPRGKPRIQVPERCQVKFRAASLDALVATDHPVRTVWDYVEQALRKRLRSIRWPRRLTSVRCTARFKSRRTQRAIRISRYPATLPSWRNGGREWEPRLLELSTSCVLRPQNASMPSRGTADSKDFWSAA